MITHSCEHCDEPILIVFTAATDQAELARKTDAHKIARHPELVTLDEHGHVKWKWDT